MWEPFIQQCVKRPSYMLMERGYDEYCVISRPCQRGAANQCAVRMSIALGRSGFGLESFQPRDRMHSGNGQCQTNGMQHVLGANELANWLRDALGAPMIIRPAPGSNGCANAYGQLQGSKGIVYFNNCFIRDGEVTAQGDHIDLFDGAQYYNQIINPAAGGDETSGGSLFGRANQVWFWPLQ